MDTIPDVALINIFSYLETEDLIGWVRGVCRRWRNLAVSARAWKNRYIVADWRGKRKCMTMQVLRLTPCLETFRADVDTLKAVKGFLKLAYSTPCAVRCLVLQIPPRSAKHIIDIIRNQVKLGRLQSLSLMFYCSSDDVRQVLEFVGKLHLDELAISLMGQVDVLEVLPDLSWGSGTVKHFRYNCPEEDDDLFAVLVYSRAESIEEISVGFATRSVYTAPINVLSECRKLRKVTLPAVVEASCVLDCPNLTCLRMNIGISPFAPFPDDLAPALLVLFERATRLTELDLQCVPLRPKNCTMVVDMLAALASSGQSCLEKLKVGSLSDVYPPDPGSLEDYALLGKSPFESKSDCSLLEQLPSVLKGLPKLRNLRLSNCPSVKTLDEIDIQVAPNLQNLKIKGIFMCSPLTVHHVQAVARLVQRLPGLHAEIICNTDCENETCSSVLGPQGGIGMFSHSPQQVCKQHTVGLVWRAICTGSAC